MSAEVITNANNLIKARMAQLSAVEAGQADSSSLNTEPSLFQWFEAVKDKYDLQFDEQLEFTAADYNHLKQESARLVFEQTISASTDHKVSALRAAFEIKAMESTFKRYGFDVAAFDKEGVFDKIKDKVKSRLANDVQRSQAYLNQWQPKPSA